MNILNLFRKPKIKIKEDGFADFFLNASNKDKKIIFNEVARRANKDQRELVSKFEKNKYKTT